MVNPHATMHLGRCACAFVLAASTTACFVGSYEVVRVHDGRPRAERFVSEEAYAASLEASIAEAKRDWAGAIVALKKALDEDPDAADLLARLGYAYCIDGKSNEAYASFREALAADPQLARAFVLRAKCTLERAHATSPFAGGAEADAWARDDLAHAIAADPESLDASLVFAELDLFDGKVAAARARIEEAVHLHPTSAAAYSLLTEICVRGGDVRCATDAALATARLDTDLGAHAKKLARSLADVAGVANYGLALRDVRPSNDPIVPSECASLVAALVKVAAHGDAKEIRVAAEGTIAACPAAEADAIAIEVEATWSPEDGAAIEARALEAPAAHVRRWGARMRLRHLSLDALLADDALPKVEDRATLAISIAAEALRKAKANAKDADAMKLASSAVAMAEEEPTVMRLVAEAAKLEGAPQRDAFRAIACALARTKEERAGCSSG